MKRLLLVVAATLSAGSLLLASPASADPVGSPVTSLSEGDTGWSVAHAQKQLAYLGYPVSDYNRKKAYYGPSTTKMVKRFQSKFGLSQTGKLDRKTVRALDKYAGGGNAPKRCVTGKFTICVNKFTRTVQAISPDGDILKVFDARFGRPGLETREGKFTVQRKGGAHYMSSEYDVEMPYPIFFSGGQAVHYSHEFAGYGYARQSHGCVGTRDYDAQKWLWNHADIGDPVIVYDAAP